MPRPSTRHRAAAVVTSLLAALTGLAVAAGHAAADPSYGGDCAPLSRPTALPLPAGMTGGEADGGQGDTVLYGAVNQTGGPPRPAVWRRAAGSRIWSVRDLSRGGTITGIAQGRDAAGDVLVSTGVVLTRSGAAITLPGFAGPHSSVYARRINARGQIAGGVFGPDPQDISAGAVWRSPTSTPRPLAPLPVTGTFDSLALGLNDRGDTVGNSDIGTSGDFAGGYWPAGSPNGVPLPGLTADHSFPLLINNAGRIAGWAGNDDGSVVIAAVWNRDRHLTTLGYAQTTDTFSSFYGLSADGRTVGTSADATSSRLIYWRGRPGDPLRTLLPLSGTWQNGNANAHYVTDSGFISGDSTNTAGHDVPTIWPCADRQSFIAPGQYGH